MQPFLYHHNYHSHNENNVEYFRTGNFINSSFFATRYHSLIIENKSLNKDFEIIAHTDNKIIMSIAHKIYKIYGVQFHPESIGTPIGKILLKNYLEIINYEN